MCSTECHSSYYYFCFNLSIQISRDLTGKYKSYNLQIEYGIQSVQSDTGQLSYNRTVLK